MKLLPFFRKKDTLKFIKLNPDSKIPTRDLENAGYDIYPLFEEDELVIGPKEVLKISTGIASVIPKGYYIQIEDRSSTSKLGIKHLAGVIDSGYRGEWIIYITNVSNVPIFISKDEDEVFINKYYIKYPYSKAIVQGILHSTNNEISSEEISFEEFKKYTSNRGDGLEGSTGK